MKPFIITDTPANKWRLLLLYPQCTRCGKPFHINDKVYTNQHRTFKKYLCETCYGEVHFDPSKPLFVPNSVLTASAELSFFPFSHSPIKEATTATRGQSRLQLQQKLRSSHAITTRKATGGEHS